MHEDEVAIDLDIARALIDEQFQQWRSEPVRAVPAAGTVNAIFRIGTAWAARFPLRAQDPATLSAALRSEAVAMTELSGHCRFPTPRPVAIGRPGPSYPLPWSVQTWLPGMVATADGLALSATFAHDLADLIRSLRSAPLRGRGFSGTGRGGQLPDHDGWIALCFQNSAQLVDVPTLRTLWSRLRELPTTGADVMSHRDLTPANLLVKGEHLAGVLDGGSFGPADPALDLVAAWHLLDRPARQVLRAELDCSTVEWLRGAAWALQQAMGLVWYYVDTNPVMSALGRSTLERILADPDLRAVTQAQRLRLDRG